MAAGEGRLSRQSALPTTDKNECLWVVAQSSLPQEILNRQDKMQVRQCNFSDVGLKKRERVKVLNVNESFFTEIFFLFMRYDKL